jgi:peptidoglycan/LPS O-acetylase OafA/YrhL
MLLHSPLTAQLGVDTKLEVLVLLACAFLVTLTVTLASYRFLEAPLLRLKSRFH